MRINTRSNSIVVFKWKPLRYLFYNPSPSIRTSTYRIEPFGSTAYFHFPTQNHPQILHSTIGVSIEGAGSVLQFLTHKQTIQEKEILFAILHTNGLVAYSLLVFFTN